MTRGLALPCQFVHVAAVDLYAVSSDEHIAKSSPEPLAVAQKAFSLGLYSLFPCFTPIFFKRGRYPG